jgi:hypothetical protein
LSDAVPRSPSAVCGGGVARPGEIAPHFHHGGAGAAREQKSACAALLAAQVTDDKPDMLA